MRHITILMIKTDQFDDDLQQLAKYAKVLSHPARLMILQFLAEKKVCISGDITNEIPLSRTTVSQHLKELKKVDLIQGSIEGLKINYCMNYDSIKKLTEALDQFFNTIESENSCSI